MYSEGSKIVRHCHQGPVDGEHKSVDPCVGNALVAKEGLRAAREVADDCDLVGI